jgi:hypothetical protein
MLRAPAYEASVMGAVWGWSWSDKESKYPPLALKWKKEGLIPPEVFPNVAALVSTAVFSELRLIALVRIITTCRSIAPASNVPSR